MLINMLINILTNILTHILMGHRLMTFKAPFRSELLPAL